MSLADSLKPIVFKLRGIAGSLGFRPFTIQIIKRTYTGNSWDGVAYTEQILSNIEEGNNQSPKVKFLSQRDYVAGLTQDAEIEVGPITPYYFTGDGYVGTEIPEPEKGQEIFFILNGLGFNNARFTHTYIKTERALGWYLGLKRVSNEADK